MRPSCTPLVDLDEGEVGRSREMPNLGIRISISAVEPHSPSMRQ